MGLARGAGAALRGICVDVRYSWGGIYASLEITEAARRGYCGLGLRAWAWALTGEAGLGA